MMLPIRNSQSWLPSIFNDFFDNDWVVKTNTTAPAINVIEHDNSYAIEMAAPGMTKNDFQVQLDSNDNLIINMEKKDDKEQKPNNGHYLRREFSYTKFQQTMILPDDVDKEKIEAHMEHGVLHIELPKKKVEPAVTTSRHIEIK